MSAGQYGNNGISVMKLWRNHGGVIIMKSAISWRNQMSSAIARIAWRIIISGSMVA